MIVEYRLFKRDPGFRPRVLDEPDQSERTGEPRIRCPICRWEPQKSSRWFCAPCPQPEGLLKGCGTLWHTFDTGGLCPGCLHRWRWTCCLACAGWSRHEDWYTK